MSSHHGYRFVRELASGGMGRVDLVVRREGTFARAYALKRPIGEANLDGTVRAMLLEEARVAGLVRNAHVVPVLDVGEDDEGLFLVMELIDGVSLGTLIERLGQRLPLQVCVEIGRQIAEGLHAAHELVSSEGLPMELVHRDLTPSNVLVGFDGIVRVIDFGVAKARDRASMSRAGVPKGKRAYMAPEQLEDRPVDRRTDLFALGVVLAEMVRGGRLHGDVTAAEVARRTLEEPPPDLGAERDDVPPELVMLAFELMARAQGDRPRDARMVATNLSAIHDALRAEEGPIDLGELVRGRCEDVRRENARMLADALRDEDPTRLEITLPPDATPAPRSARSAATTPAIPPPSSGQWDVQTDRDVPPPAELDTFIEPPKLEPPLLEPPPAERPPSPRFGVRGAVASVLGLVLAASVLWAVTRGEESSAGSSEPRGGSTLTAPPAIEATPTSPPEPAIPADPGLGSEDVDAPAGPAPHRRPRARPRDRGPREAQGEGIRTWDWE